MAAVWKGFESSVKACLDRVNHYMVDFREANFALEGNRVKAWGLLNYLPVDDEDKLLLLYVPNMLKVVLGSPLPESEWVAVRAIARLPVLIPACVSDRWAGYPGGLTIDKSYQEHGLLLLHFSIKNSKKAFCLFRPNILTQPLFRRTTFCFSLVIEHPFNLSKTWQFRIQDNQNTAFCSFRKMKTLFWKKNNSIEKWNRS